MISYQEALDIISAHSFSLKKEKVNIESANGRVLAQNVYADRDFPPFDRVTMDGIAINYEAFASGQRTFDILEVIGAGVPKKTISDPLRCVQIMTGAIMPEGLDTVIRYEDITIKDDKATINLKSIKDKQNVHFKGEDKKQGEVVIQKGTEMSPSELIVAAAVGKSELEVYQLPKAAIITTGDELVDIKEQPKEHQIRRSSNYGILASLKNWKIEVDQFHLNDNKDILFNKLSELTETFDLLVITGGVSRGKYDYLPEIMDQIGVEKHFHKVKQRPGKPFWFGTIRNKCTVFALPGNPVSSFVCAHVYLKFWIRNSLGLDTSLDNVKLSNDITFTPSLTYFLECTVRSNEQGERIAESIKGNGSGDFANLTSTDGFLVLPEQKNDFKAGEVYPYIPFRN